MLMPGNSTSKLAGYRIDVPGSIPSRGGGLSFRQNIQTDSGVQPDSSAMGTRGSFSRNTVAEAWSWLFTRAEIKNGYSFMSVCCENNNILVKLLRLFTGRVKVIQSHKVQIKTIGRLPRKLITPNAWLILNFFFQPHMRISAKHM
jgi:hypothetical protein